MIVRELDAADRGYALSSWRESHKQAPGPDRVPWSYYRHEYGEKFRALINDPSTALLGAYDHDGKLLGWLAMTPGKRVHTLHWVYTKWRLDDKPMRRRGVMTALLEAADLGSKFVYTLRGRRLQPDERPQIDVKTLDDILVPALRAKGVTATYVALKEWLK